MPKIAKKLTKADIASAIVLAKGGKRVELSDAAVTGLRFRVTPSGKTSWALATRDKFGTYRKFPIVARNLDEARKVALVMRDHVLAGGDPLEDRRLRRLAGEQAKVGMGTLAAVLDTYAGDRGPGSKKRSWSLLDKSIRRVFKRHLDKPYEALSVRSLQKTVDDHPGTQSCAHAVRAVRPMFKWASGHVDRFPDGLWKIEAPAANASRDRVLSRDELARLVPVLREKAGVHGRACMFMLMTLARVNEVCTARWRDLDEVADEPQGRANRGKKRSTSWVWTMPTTKSGQPHKVPLSRHALHVLGPRPDDPDSLLFPSERGTKLGNWDRMAKGMMKESGVNGWTRHDLRRTGATMLAEMKCPPHVVESALGHVHVHTPLASIYSRVRYQDEVRDALKRLGWTVMPLPRVRTQATDDHNYWPELEDE